MFGTVVLSIAGRDKGSYFIVTEIKDNYAYIVDGNIHKVENPKYKKIKHVEIAGICDEELRQKLISKSKITNQELKRAIRKLHV